MKTPEHIYSPACARCRDEAGKDRAGVTDTSLCNWHTNDLVLSLRAENERLREALRGAEAHHDEQARLWADNEGDGEADLNAQYHSERRDVFTAVLAEVGK